MRKSILIIDEEIDIRELLEYNFTQSGYKVYQADRSLEGIKLAISNLPDVILLGTFYSEQARADAYCELRKIPSLVKSNIMCLTTDSEFHSRSYNSLIHHNDCIQAPITPRELLNSIENRFKHPWVAC